MVFKQGDEQGALHICNLLDIPRDLSWLIREEISKETGIPFQNITVSATHTHTSPAITEEFQKFIDNGANGKLVDSDETSYFRYLINGMTKAVLRMHMKIASPSVLLSRFLQAIMFVKEQSSVTIIFIIWKNKNSNWSRFLITSYCLASLAAI